NESPDWIELFNNSDSSFNLNGWRISDKKDFESAWVIEDRIIESKGFIVIHASEKNRCCSGYFNLEASGQGLFPYTYPDGFYFGYTKLTGDFDISVQVRAFSKSQLSGNAGLLIREELKPDSKFAAMICYHPDRTGFALIHKEELETYPINTPTKLKCFYPNGRINISRNGDSIHAYVLDKDFLPIEQISILLPLNNEVFVGIETNSGDENNLAKATFAYLEINDQTFEFSDLKFADINTTIPGKNYSNDLHTNFKISRDIETIYLWNAQADLVDSIKIENQKNDISTGRYPDGGDAIKLFYPSTPNRQNSKPYERFTANPEFSQNSGFFESDLMISVNTNSDINVFYTANGSIPDEQSTLYKMLLDIKGNSIIRAKSYCEDLLPSEIITQSYFINENSKLPVISLVADSNDLFGDRGIYTDKYLYWNFEIPGFFEYFDESGTTIYKSGCGLAIHGGATRGYPQKSFRLYTRANYGASSFDNLYWCDIPIKQYDKLVLRNSGQDWHRTLIKDLTISASVKDISTIDKIAGKSVNVFLNGKYWGIYNLRERLDDDYLGEIYNISKKSITLLKGDDIFGSSKTYDTLYAAIMEKNFSEDKEIQFANSLIDLDNFIDYGLINLYFHNYDWPDNNVRYWKSHELDNRWRWILYDLDLSFGTDASPPEENSIMRISKIESKKYSDIFNKLLENVSFRNRFINRAADFMNSVFLPEKIIGIIDSISAIILPEIPRHKQRWPESAVDWEMCVDKMRVFANERPDCFREHIVNQFKLQGTVNIKLNANIQNACSIKINTIDIGSFLWEGVYFKGIPVNITISPENNYRFIRWEGDVNSNNNSITIIPEDNISINAILEADNCDMNIVINEIMHKCADEKDSKDWIELYNAGGIDIDISGWIIKDDNDTHEFIIPDNTLINREEYLVICRDSEAFNDIYPEVENYIGDLDFGISKDDQVRLFYENGELMDFVDYTFENPWPCNSNGTGYSLELKLPDLDNNFAGNWQSSYKLYGTPGEKNSFMINVADSYASGYIDIVNYPNPFSHETTIRFNLAVNSQISLNIYNNLGIELFNLIDNRRYQSGTYQVKFSADDLESDIYYCALEISGKGLVKAIPLIILK
ncbi:CotH kinase family protein, partial [Bacteroidota bacterium]